MIQVVGVSKTFRIPHERRRTLFHRVFGGYEIEVFHALSDVSFEVPRGQFLGIAGSNGSGKSTLLRIVAGIYPPSAGSVRVGGAVAPVLDLGVGFHPALPVRDNVLLYGVLLGIPRARLREQQREILEAAGVQRFADAPLSALSTGMKMRLAFTLALRAEAPVLLVDEALAVGDEEFQQRCRAELERRRAAGVTALLVSHDRRILQQLCERVIVLEAGCVRGDGPTKGMLERHAV